MARVTLIVYTNKLNVIGVRSLSAYLKAKGHDARIIYLLSAYHEYYDVFPDSLYDQLAEACRDSDLIGFSLTSNFHREAVKATRRLKKLNKPIVWGGIHPTLCPDLCIKEVDIISRGESEEALLELTEAVSRGSGYSGIKNLWIRTNSPDGQERIVKNPVRPLIQDIDSMPFNDLDFESHLLSEGGALKRITPDLMKRYMTSGNTWEGRIDYYLSTSRGCPFRCTYCCNSGLHELYGGDRVIRKRSVGRVLAEAEEAIRRYPFINYIFLSDEELFVQSAEYLQEFSREFKARIGLPMKAEFTPILFNEKKFRALIDAGMVEALMGVQSASDRTSEEMYGRKMKSEKMLGILDAILPYRKSLKHCHLHFIVFNKMEGEESTRKTYEFISKVDKFFDLTFFPLVYFPGTPLAEKARAAGIVGDGDYLEYLAKAGFDKVKEAHKADYYTICFMLLDWFKKKLRLPVPMCRAVYAITASRAGSAIFKHRFVTTLLIKLYVFLLSPKFWHRKYANAAS